MLCGPYTGHACMSTCSLIGLCSLCILQLDFHDSWFLMHSVLRGYLKDKVQYVAGLQYMCTSHILWTNCVVSDSRLTLYIIPFVTVDANKDHVGWSYLGTTHLMASLDGHIQDLVCNPAMKTAVLEYLCDHKAPACWPFYEISIGGVKPFIPSTEQCFCKNELVLELH